MIADERGQRDLAGGGKPWPGQLSVVAASRAIGATPLAVMPIAGHRSTCLVAPGGPQRLRALPVRVVTASYVGVSARRLPTPRPIAR